MTSTPQPQTASLESSTAHQEESSSPLPPRLETLFAELFVRSGAARFGITADEFNQILLEVGKKYLLAEAAITDAKEFYAGLHVEELALARACAAGKDSAWDAFLTRYRTTLHDAALGITNDDVNARELADSIYSELYGLSSRDGQRMSKLNSYMGRGSLAGWLRTVLAQEYVNRYRSRKRLVSLEEQTEVGAQFIAASDTPSVAIDARLAAGIDESLRSLAPEDRLILAAYYLDGRRLADIARMLRVHESTISRKLEKITRDVRERILKELVRRGMTRRQAEEALETDVRDLVLDVRASLAQDTSARSFLKK
jgi:RNA polymerase sigma-70 factor (ECF subfamily)